MVCRDFRARSLTTVSVLRRPQRSLNRLSLPSVSCVRLFLVGNSAEAHDADARHPLYGSTVFVAHTPIAECVHGRCRYCEHCAVTRVPVGSDDGAARGVRGAGVHCRCTLFTESVTRGPRGEDDPGFSFGRGKFPRVSTVRPPSPCPAVPSVIASEKNRCVAFASSIPRFLGTRLRTLWWFYFRRFSRGASPSFLRKQSTGSWWICCATPMGIGSTQLIANRRGDVEAPPLAVRTRRTRSGAPVRFPGKQPPKWPSLAQPSLFVPAS